MADFPGHAWWRNGSPDKPGTARSKSGSVDSTDSSKVTSCSSKKSKARADKDRGPKRWTDKLARVRKQVEAKGGTWSDNHGTETAELVLVESGSYKGSVARANYTACINETNDSYVDEGAGARVMDALIKEIPLVQARYISVKEDLGPWCNLCSKCATEGHISSGQHKLAMEESALSDAMSGQIHKGFRRYGKLCEGCPTKRLMMDWWGENITYLPEYAIKVHKKKKEFYINEKDDKPITVDQATHELGIVSYKGDGKYNASTYIPYHNLPDSEEVATEEQLRTTSPAGQGWWPVISLKEENTKQHGRCILLVCFYQLQMKGKVPAWWIWPEWVDQQRLATVPEATAMPKSGAASSSTAPPPPPPPTGVWAEQEDDQDVEMDEVW